MLGMPFKGKCKEEIEIRKTSEVDHYDIKECRKRFLRGKNNSRGTLCIKE